MSLLFSGPLILNMKGNKTMINNNIVYVNSANFDKEVLGSDKPVIVDFFSDDCPPCDVLAPIFEKMADTYGDHIKFVKIFRQENRELAVSLNVTSSPTVLFLKQGQEIGYRLNGYMTKPQFRKAIEENLGDMLPPSELKKVECDTLILGGGPAGLSAAIYASRAKLKTILLEEGICGGQAATTYHVANYPGTSGTVNGQSITNNMREQALSFGSQIDEFKEIFEVDFSKDVKYVRTDDSEYFARTVIAASGASPRMLEAKGAFEAKGRGIHYCATCDGAMYQDRHVAVVGGGSSAIEEAIFLTRFASRVTIIHRRDGFRAAGSEIDAAMANPRIEFLLNRVVSAVKTEGYGLKSLVLEDVKTGEIVDFSVDGAFVYIGYDPASALFKEQLALDETGYIIAGEDTKTNIDGVFAAGDIRTKQIRQIVTAAADGAVAGIMAEKYLASN